MGRFEVTHTSDIPSGVTKEKALSVLHDNEAYFTAAEHYREHKNLGGDGGSPDKIPEDLKSKMKGSHAAYEVRNEVPNPVFDSNVNTTYTIVNLDDGMFYHAASPMGVTNDARWTVQEVDGGLKLHASIFVDCNMMLKPVVKGQVETSTKQISAALIQRMQ